MEGTEIFTPSIVNIKTQPAVKKKKPLDMSYSQRTRTAPRVARPCCAEKEEMEWMN
jgi:hypothetical protein